MRSHGWVLVLAGVLLVALCAALAATAPAVAAGDGTGGAEETRVTVCTAGSTSAVSTEADGDGLSLETFVAPGREYDALRNASAFHAAREAGTLTPADAGVDRTHGERVVAYRDVVVHRLSLNGSATGLLDRLAAQEEGSPTANFRALAAGDDIAVEYRGATACPPELALNASLDRGAIRAVPDRPNDTLYLAFDTERLLFHPLDNGDPTTDTFVKGHHGFGLALRAESGLVAEDATVGADYRVEDAGASFVSRRDGLVEVEADRRQRLRGRTTLAPGSELTLRLHSLTATVDPTATNATVNRSRAFTATFDLSNASDDLFAVEAAGITDPPVVGGGATLVAAGDATGAVVTASNQSSDGTVFYGPALTTTDGGFVAVRDESGDLVGVSEFHAAGSRVAQVELSPPLTGEQTVTVTLYRDVDGDGTFGDADVPYRIDGDPVRDTATVEVERDHRTRTTTEESTPSGETTSTTEPARTPSASAASGFGPLAALLALVVAGGLRARNYV